MQAARQLRVESFVPAGYAAEMVGRTPWPARDALVPLLEKHQRPAGCEQADGGVGRGPGVRPTIYAGPRHREKANGLELPLLPPIDHAARAAAHLAIGRHPCP